MAAIAHAQSPSPPNMVIIDPLLVTSGQPAAATLATLGAQGFKAVIYLAPSNVWDAVGNEAEILKKQGVEFVHIPIPFGAPQPSHYEAVAAALDRLKGQKVLVHCQVNMRASTMVFLYRVIRRGEDPGRAYEAVARIWSPHGEWKQLMETELRAHKVDFEPY